MTAPKVGDKIATWFSDQPDDMSTVIAVRPYQGVYPQFFDWIVVVTAPRTGRGYVEMAI